MFVLSIGQFGKVSSEGGERVMNEDGLWARVPETKGSEQKALNPLEQQFPNSRMMQPT